MARELTLGIDLGSSSVKCVLLDRSGCCVAASTRPVVTTYPAPGQAEQDPDSWWSAVTAAVRELTAGIAPGEVVAIGICGAAHIPVLLNAQLQPVRPAILWTDQRSGEQVQRLAAACGPQLLATCFNQPSCTWTLPQLMWLHENEPDTFQQARHLLLGKDYIVYRLTSRLVTDTGNAASTLMMDMQRSAWAEEFVVLTGLPASALPPILACHEVAGRLLPEPARQLHLSAGIPVVAGALDSVMELLVLGVIDNGQAMLRLGTAGGIMVVTAQARPAAGVITYPFLFNKGWCCQAFTNSCASAVGWVQQLLGIGGDTGAAFQEFAELAAAAPPGSEGLIFHPYLLGERAPLWDPLLRASFVGAAMRHGRAHFARAVLEGVAYSIRECCDLLCDIGYDITALRLAGGGARSRLWRQIVGDVLGRELTRTNAEESSATGAAMLAAIGVGLFADMAEAAGACGGATETVQPDVASYERYDQVYQCYIKIRAGLQPYYHREGRSL